jgi:hypothetical protein
MRRAASLLALAAAVPALAAPSASAQEPPAPADPVWGTVEVPPIVSRANARNRGIRIVVSGQQAGTARVRGTLGGATLVVRTDKRLKRRTRTVFRAKLTARGRSLVARGRNFVVSLSVRLPGEPDPHVQAVRVRG